MKLVCEEAYHIACGYFTPVAGVVYNRSFPIAVDIYVDLFCCQVRTFAFLCAGLVQLGTRALSETRVRPLISRQSHEVWGYQRVLFAWTAMWNDCDFAYVHVGNPLKFRKQWASLNIAVKGHEEQERNVNCALQTSSMRSGCDSNIHALWLCPRCGLWDCTISEATLMNSLGSGLSTSKSRWRQPGEWLPVTVLSNKTSESPRQLDHVTVTCSFVRASHTGSRRRFADSPGLHNRRGPVWTLHLPCKCSHYT